MASKKNGLFLGIKFQTTYFTSWLIKLVVTMSTLNHTHSSFVKPFYCYPPFAKKKIPKEFPIAFFSPPSKF